MNLFRFNMKHFKLPLKRFYSSRSSRKATSSAEYCLESVKRYDYENFICTLLLTNSARSSAFAVRSFNVEVSRVSQQVSESNIGLMRLKFWEDAINSCFGIDQTKIPQHPVALELFKAINKTKLSKRYFKSLITCRQDHLSNSTFKNLEAVEKYAEQSVSSVYYLILEGSGITNVHADHAASHLGKAQGIVQLLRSVNMAKELNIIPYPQDILTKHNVSQEEVLRGITSERLNECSFEVASRAYQHLVKARSLLKDIPPEARCILLPSIAVENYLNRLQKVNHDVLNPKLHRKSSMWLLKLWFTKFRKKY